MIKFVLHGGDFGDKNSDNIGFYKEMTSGRNKPINFLINCFSCDENRVLDKFQRHSALFKKYCAGKTIVFKLADEDKFIKQLKWADVVFFEGGGSTEKLVEKLSKYDNFDKLLENKVVGGSSAGANCLSKYFYGNMSQKIGKGLGILNIKTFCHYVSGDYKITQELSEYKEKIPLLILPNYKRVVIYS
ncbi:MAG: hypothetical protein US62_C0009G0013 [Candidatus Woesebacteria bacterium GW2011_GWA1_37_8]|uniref:Peptidase E n=2 Tax=Candidatus Woeseibacteriota TaxID=1752722 RepID=A0A0G0LFF9_9BACT|nr:MAG: hypothetical protein US39_C0002G0053 [Microgenomates group bacterium GW2011_GWC1_37_12b]KKQ45782.1 MAG: hypothetical protein US62_C0009G0013 [Candidatus Woesebacteria bacterium GW2011_GWA1_37_8]KKQ86670.1 MAG: hypothetical protein UT10_C0019G0030 [Candidatus Woesebacteria bacterium GW2011_GWB1_38_8b]